jgi:uncharacterized membrane protein
MDKIEKKFKLPSWLNLALIIGEIVLTVFLVTVSIIAMVTVNNDTATGFIKWLALNPLWFFILIVFPLIVLFLVNVFLLIKAVNTQKEVSLGTAGMSPEQLLEEARRQAREELMAEMNKEAVDEKKDK